MARTDEGEFELVLGNRQLISVFLIVVILLGVFFSMGYIVGRNSAPVATEARNTQPPRPIVVEQPARTPNKDAEPTAPIEPAPQTTTPPPTAEKKELVKPPPAAAPAPEKKVPPPSEPAASGIVEQPPAGRYWQVVSTSRHEAEIESSAIVRKGLRSIVTPAPKKEGYFRVLVGPLGNAADVAKTRTELEAMGFKNPVLAKY